MRPWHAAVVGVLFGAITQAVAGGFGVGSGGLQGGSSSGAGSSSSSGASASFGFVDAGILSVTGQPTGTECVAGFDSPDTSTRAICFDQAGGTAIAGTSRYLAWNTGAGTLSLVNGVGDLNVNSGTNNTIHLNSAAAGAVRITGSQSVGSCTLNGATPAVCTATVRAASNCVANTVGTTAASAKALAVNLVTTTLTVTAANGSTEVVNYHCF